MSGTANDIKESCQGVPERSVVVFLLQLALSNKLYNNLIKGPCSEEVNRKLPARNTMVQLFTFYTDPESHNAQHYSWTDDMMMSITDHTL